MPSRIELAIECALFAHSGQTDAQGAPYILHPLRVAEAVRHLGDDAYIAGVLHDTLEDTELPDVTIRRRFGDEVLRLVRALTRVITPMGEEPYDEFIDRVISEGELTVAIKEADINDNLSRLEPIRETDPAKAVRLERKYKNALFKIWNWRQTNAGAHY